MGFFDGGAKSLSFGKMGDMTWRGILRGGVITDISDEKPQTDWKTGKIIFGKDGVTPKTQVIVTLSCVGGGELIKAAYAAGDEKVKSVIGQLGGPRDERTDPSDDGRRGVYVKGNLRFDLGNELRRCGAREPLIGGELYLAFTDTRSTDSGEGRSYVVIYLPPAAGSVAGGFYDTSAPAAAPAQQGFQTQGNGFAQQSAAPPPAFGGGAPAAQQPPAASPPPTAPADPWGAAPAAQQTAQPSASPWG